MDEHEDKVQRFVESAIGEWEAEAEARRERWLEWKYYQLTKKASVRKTRMRGVPRRLVVNRCRRVRARASCPFV